MKELVEFIVKRLVDNPDLVNLAEEHNNNNILLRLTVSEQDVGKVIGRKGRTVQALRTIAGAVAAKDGKRAILEIAE